MVVNQAIRRNGAKLLIVADKKGKLDKLPGAKTLLSKPGLELDVLNAMAKVLLDEGFAKTEGVEGLEELKQGAPEVEVQLVFGQGQLLCQQGPQLRIVGQAIHDAIRRPGVALGELGHGVGQVGQRAVGLVGHDGLGHGL